MSTLPPTTFDPNKYPREDNEKPAFTAEIFAEKKHNTAATSRESFSAYTASGKRSTEREKALAAIGEWQPLTSRKLAELMQVERCHVTRCIYDLMQAGRVRISHVAKCQVTGKRVQHYCLTGWQPSLFNQ